MAQLLWGELAAILRDCPQNGPKVFSESGVLLGHQFLAQSPQQGQGPSTKQTWKIRHMRQMAVEHQLPA